VSRLSSTNNPQCVQKVKDDIDLYANAGHRTLVYAFKLIDPKEYEKLLKKYKNASGSIGKHKSWV
jgi:hypothetical protein